MGELPIVGGIVKEEILHKRHNNNQLGGNNGGKVISEVRKHANKHKKNANKHDSFFFCDINKHDS